MLEFLEAICEAEGITVIDFDFNGKMNGMATMIEGHKAIAIESTLKGWARLEVLAHELGHHVLCHVGANEGMFSRERRENEAQAFSAAFTAMSLFARYKQELNVSTGA
jgi:Zn-dependent peptidase ImmA (M78 family)